MAMTWDMYTSGPYVGQVKRPLRYTETEDDACRVRVYCQLATSFGKYVFNTEEGLDYERILDPTATDAERGAMVRDIVLADEHVESVEEGPDVTVNLGAPAGPTVSIKVTFKTVTGTTIGMEV